MNAERLINLELIALMMQHFLQDVVLNMLFTLILILKSVNFKHLPYFVYAKLRVCIWSSEPMLSADAISTKISCGQLVIIIS